MVVGRVVFPQVVVSYIVRLPGRRGSLIADCLTQVLGVAGSGAGHGGEAEEHLVGLGGGQVAGGVLGLTFTARSVASSHAADRDHRVRRVGQDHDRAAARRPARHPDHHLDAIYHDDQWNKMDPDKFAAAQEELVAAQTWVIDGNYASTLPIRLKRQTPSSSSTCPPSPACGASPSAAGDTGAASTTAPASTTGSPGDS